MSEPPTSLAGADPGPEAGLGRAPSGEPGSARRRVAGRDRSDEWWRLYAAAVAVFDAVAMVVGAFVGQTVRFGGVGTDPASTRRLLVATALMTPGWVLTLSFGAAYQRRALGTGSEEYRRVLLAGARFFAVVAVVAFFLQVDVVRGFVAVAIPMATAGTLVMRYLLRRWLHRQRTDGRFTRGALIVGSAEDTLELVRSLRSAPHAGLTAIGACVPGGLESLEIDGLQVDALTEPGAVLDAVLMSGADVVVVADGRTLSHGALRRLAWQLEGTGVDLMVAPVVTDLAGPRISIRPVADLPLLHVEEPELRGASRLVKATFDRVLAATGLVLLSPLLAVIALFIRVTSKGPVFFRQVRIGLGGRPFVVLKFRTMEADAETRLPELAQLNEHDGLLFKIRRDPRVTPVGRFLRRWSLDELPQLWNVLRGEMSIVGPRPPLPTEVERFSDEVRRRFLVKPGLTGLWQVSGRWGLSWEEAVRLDLYYVENWSLSMDAAIVARTVSAVVRGQGAC